MSEASELLRQLRSLLEAAGGFEASSIEIRDSGHEVVVCGNKAGLIWLASQVLALAERTTFGAHIHIDSASGADVADRPLILQLSCAPEA